MSVFSRSPFELAKSLFTVPVGLESMVVSSGVVSDGCVAESPVVKDQANQPSQQAKTVQLSALPTLSVAPSVPVQTIAWYLLFACKLDEGVSVAVLPSGLSFTLALTKFQVAVSCSAKVSVVTVSGFIASEKVISTSAASATPVALHPGTMLM